MKRQKKGFTITELVIVIAVIAVLAAVLIPTFVSLVRKANESKDIQLVHNLNTALTVDGGEHKTMQSALDAAFESGYDVDKINASATGNEILWDSVNDKFCYLKDGNIEYIPETELSNKNPDNVAYWQICNEMPTEQKYSIYAGENWTDEVTGLTVGFDAGKNNIESVKYERIDATDERNVIIRTNSGKLTINAANDNVTHYGVADDVEIQAVKNQSYHERGTAAFVQIASGHLAVENGGKILLVQKTNADATVTNNGGTVEGAVATSDALKIEIPGVTCEVKTQAEVDALKTEKIEQNIVETLEVGNNIARINRECYATLNDAIDAVKDGDTIVVLNNTTVNNLAVGSSSNKNARKITLDLNGKEITGAKEGTSVFRVFDNLTICGEGKINSKTSGVLAGIAVFGTLTIDGPTISYIKPEKDIGGDVISVNTNAVVTLKSGIISSQYVKNGTINVSSSGEFIMDGGIVKNTYSTYGGTFEAKGVAIYANGNVSINGGTVESKVAAAIYVINRDTKKTVVNGGTLKGAQTIFNKMGIIEIKGGSFEGQTECVYAYNAQSKIYISGGEFKAIYDNGKFTLNKLDSVKDSALIEVSGGTFYGYNPAESNSENPVQNFVKSGYVSNEKDGNIYEVVKG